MNVLSYIFLREIRQVDFSMHQQFGLYLPLGHLEHLGFADGSKSVVVLEPMRRKDRLCHTTSNDEDT